jgi:hypothetical protein
MTGEPYEVAMASANRVLAYARNLQEETFRATGHNNLGKLEPIALPATLSSALLVIIAAFAKRETAKGTCAKHIADATETAFVAILADVFNNGGEGQPEKHLEQMMNRVKATIYQARVQADDRR